MGDGDYEPEGEKFRRMTESTVEMFPVLWHGLYVNCIKEGFTKEEALALVRTYILGAQIGSVKCT